MQLRQASNNSIHIKEQGWVVHLVKPDFESYFGIKKGVYTVTCMMLDWFKWDIFEIIESQSPFMQQVDNIASGE